jgi:hypothetical protein
VIIFRYDENDLPLRNFGPWNNIITVAMVMLLKDINYAQLSETRYEIILDNTVYEIIIYCPLSYDK